MFIRVLISLILFLGILLPQIINAEEEWESGKIINSFESWEKAKAEGRDLKAESMVGLDMAIEEDKMKKEALTEWVYSDSLHNYSLVITRNWEEINKKEIEEIKGTIVKNEKQNVFTYETGFKLKSNRDTFEYPYILTQYLKLDSSFYSHQQLVDQFLDVDENGLNSMKRNTFKEEFSNAINVRIVNKYYDSNKKAVIIEFEGKMNDYAIKTLSVYFLGREGITCLYFNSRAEEYDNYFPTIDLIINSFKYNPGHEYREDHEVKKIPGIFDSALNEGIKGSVTGLVFGIFIATYMVLRFIFKKMKNDPKNQSGKDQLNKEQRQCPKCNRKINSDSVFCPNCGEKLTKLKLK